MGSKFLTKTTLSDFNVLTWKSKPIFYYYETICAFLRDIHLDEVADILAMPQPKLEGNRIMAVDWVATIKPQNAFQSYTQLAAEEKSIIKNKLSDIYQQLDTALASFKDDDSKEKRDWAELLSFISYFPDDEFIYSDGNNIFIAAWGFKSKNQLGLKDIESKGESKVIVPPIEVDDKAEEFQVLENNDDQNDNHFDEDELDDSDTSKDINDNTEEENDELKINDKKNNEIKSRNPWWWLLLLLLLMIIGFFSLKTCAQKSGNLLPDPNIIIPIDTSRIDLDKDSISYIIKDRLNIIFKNKKDIDIKEFSKDFKKAFPEDDYQITYYDSLTYRMQVSTPKDKMDESKMLIKSKLSKYEMIIFQENIFNNRVQANDPGFGDVYKSWFLEKIRAYQAWDITLGNEDIIVAVLDDGFDVNHPEFQGRIYKPYNVINRTTDVFTFKQSTHGTHVAATAVGAINNRSGVSGSAPKCKLMPIQISDKNGNMSTTAIVDGLLYAIYQGADVVNMSLGMYFSPIIGLLPDDVQYNLKENVMKEEETFWNSIYEIAEENNVAIVIAGGNQSIIVGLDPKDRSDYVINVSASDVNDQRANFSNYGRLSDVTAPGTQIYSAIPSNKFDSYDGTSMSAPLVAGGIALMKSIDKNLTSEQIKYVLHTTGETLFTDKPIGRLMQLDKALKLVRDGDYENDEDPCIDVLDKLLALENQINELRALCPDLSYQDTLRIPEEPTTLDFFEGVWKSTTDIMNNDGNKVTLYFYVDSKSGNRLRLEDPDSGTCYGDIKIQLNGRQMDIEQPNPAKCLGDGKIYNPYIFGCVSDANGYAVCSAQNKVDKMNNFTFNLIRIK